MPDTVEKPSSALTQFRGAVGDALKRGDVPAAMELSEQAVAQGVEEPNILVLAGHRRMGKGHPDTALPLLLRAHTLAPANIEALNALGLCLARLDKRAEAVGAFDRAIDLAPDTAYLHIHKAQTLEELGALQQAREAATRALELEPGNAETLTRLAGLCARRGEMAEARDYATRALAIAPFPAATIALAMADNEDRQFEAARARLTPLLDDPKLGPVNRSIVHGLIGDALDGLNRPTEAFAAYTAARETLRAHTASVFAGKETALERVRRLAAHFKSAPVRPTAANEANPALTHVFLVGFPRSGTTLLEQALASHRDIQTLEEIECLRDAIHDFVSAPDGLNRLATLGSKDLEHYRNAYWKRAAEFGAQPSKAVFIDKLPLNTIFLPLIARLFPDAKILFALRDPRDVVLSCFRRRLMMSEHMAQFTTPESTATFYDAVMDLAQVYRDKLGLATHEIRHEDLLADFDDAMRRVCAFLNIAPDEAMRDFATLARTRDIKTPSALQIARGLNASGAGEWRRYRAQLAPILPVLTPWAARFGYEKA